jgi:hypothetical protein
MKAPLAVLLVAVAAAFAALADSEATAQPAARGGLMSVAADYVGLTREQLRAELRHGQSLAQVAAAEAKLDARNLSEEREQHIRARLRQRIERLVDRPWRAKGLRARAAKRGLLAAAAGYLGVTRDQLRRELRAGRSLADVAAAQGKSVAGLKQAMLDAVRARLGERPRLSAERRERLLARAERLIERMVARKRA